MGEKKYTVWVVDGWMIMDQWWNDTDRKTEVLREKYYTVWAVNEWMCVEQWWNDTNRGN